MQTFIQKAKTEIQPGTLYVVATPIGNLSDITLRALAILESADIICAEDTRVSAKLLSAYGLKKNIISVREHNEREMAQKIIEYLHAGKIVAQISDAGTPAICDPGARLVSAVKEANLPVIPIPGASAVVAALSVSGCLNENFYFGGFLHSKKTERQKQLEYLFSLNCPVVVYETPHRILDSLQDLFRLPERQIILAREITKTFETFLSGSAEELINILQKDSNQMKGEMVLIITPPIKTIPSDIDNKEVNRIIDILLQQLPTKQAAQIAAEILHQPKKDMYKQILDRKETQT